MPSLDNPPPGAEASFLLDCLSLLATSANVRGEDEGYQEVAHLVVVVPLVQTHALLAARGRLRTLYGNALNCLEGHLEIVSVGPVDREP